MKNTRIALYKIFRRMGIRRQNINVAANLFTDLLFDRVDMNIFLFLLERTFQIEVKNEEENQLQTIDDVIYYIDNRNMH